MLGANTAGVLSMLRTSTDTGDLGSLSVNQSRMPPVSRHGHLKRNNPARLSDGSLRSNQTGKTTKRSSNNQPWDGSLPSRRGSLSSLQTARTMPPYYPDQFGPAPHPPPKRTLPPNPSPAPSIGDERSYSMGQSRHGHHLAVQRSASSLRSQTTLPRMHPHRAPYMHPPRSQRPGYRSVSPALSDYMPAHGPPPGRYISRPPLASYYPDNGSGPQQAMMQPRFQGMPPVPARYPSPGPPMQQYHQPQYMYPPSMQQYSMNPRHAVMFATPRQALYPQHAMAPRAYPPPLGGTPPSSGPSSSAPHSSNPSTPQDSHSGRIAINPHYGDPAIGELQDENSEQAIFSQYMAFANKTSDELETDVEVMNYAPVHELEALTEVVTPHPSGVNLDTVPNDSSPATNTKSQAPGFVQRIKNLLETRAVAPSPTIVSPGVPRASSTNIVGRIHAVELPASPVKSAPDTSVGSRAEVRITRDLVKAFTSPSSSEHDMSAHDLTREKRASQYEPVPEEHTSEARSSSEYPSDLIPDPDPVPEQEPWHSREASVSASSIMREISQDDGVEVDGSQIDVSRDALNEIEEHLPQTHGDLNSSVEAHAAVKPGRMSSEAPGVAGEVDVSPLPTSMPGEFPHEVDDESPRGEVTTSPSKSISSHASSESLPATAATRDAPARVSHIQHFDSEDFHEGEAGITSDIVTDIAVRFSIPRHASMVKPHVVRVISTSDRATSQSRLHRDIHELPESVSPRESVQGLEFIAPLQVNKQTKTGIDLPLPTSEGADLSSFIRRTFPRRQSAFFRDASTTNGDDAVETSQAQPAKTRGQKDRLPNVKEESSEDIPNARSKLVTTDIPPVLEQPILTGDTATRLRSELTLSEIRNLPSLNFSQVDLVDQMNAALGDRDSLSLRLLKNHRSSNIISPSPVRPSSTEALRERYTSFFAKPEDFEVPAPVEETESFTVDTLVANKQADQDSHDGGGPEQQPRTNNSRPLSPTELLGVASEANRLSVPSVDGLSNRLSELLPSLKRLHLNSVITDDEAVEHTIDEIHHLGERPRTMMSARSSGVLRSLAAIADDIVTNGTHSSQLLPRQPRVNKSLPPLPKDQDTIEVQVSSENPEEDTTESSSDVVDTPRADHRRIQSETKANMIDPLGMSILTPRRSLTMHQSNSQPWNFDENYPWSSDTGLTKFKLDGTPVTQDRDSIASNLLRRTANGFSSSVSSLGADKPKASKLSPGGAGGDTTSSVSDLEPTATVTADTLTNRHHTRTLSKKASSILGSLSRARKVKSPLRSTSIDSARRPGTSASGTVTLGHSKRPKGGAGGGKSTPAPHAVGDRYPATSLQAPLGYELDEVRSYFSDDAESAAGGDGVRRVDTGKSSQLRKRLSAGLRFRTPGSRPGSAMLASPAVDGSEDVTGRRASSSFWRAASAAPAGVESASALGFPEEGVEEEGVSPRTPVNFYGQRSAGGKMGRVGFAVRKVGVRIRMVLGKAGAGLLRRVSGRGRREKIRNEREWIDGSASLYSGT